MHLSDEGTTVPAENRELWRNGAQKALQWRRERETTSSKDTGGPKRRTNNGGQRHHFNDGESFKGRNFNDGDRVLKDLSVKGERKLEACVWWSAGVEDEEGWCVLKGSKWLGSENCGWCNRLLEGVTGYAKACQNEGMRIRLHSEGVVKKVEVREGVVKVVVVKIRAVDSRPTAEKWRVNSIKHYDLMVELWVADRATGSEQPQWTGYRDPTPPSPPPSVDEYSPGQTQSMPSVPSGGTSSSRGLKRKAPMVDVIDSQFDKLTTSLDGFANVLSSSNVHFGVISDAAVRQVSAMEDRNEILRTQTEILRRTPNYTYTEADIYEMLSDMNIANENLLEQCYDFLCGNPTCTKRLMGLPPHKRWNKLCKMISGGDC
ncbi:hypothetical protein LR48_Vigan03g203900 [Vigna angularis]|uniref:Uncharacterized protein n=1 Tax=Phaseolus angularis TaxID=3914 RepID=A0A0L9U7P8_PHAAN|nr:hypothetical protein LR48_Vigan03g203900 [Vigna angularis]